MTFPILRHLPAVPGPRGSTVKHRVPYEHGERHSGGAFVDDILTRHGLGRRLPPRLTPTTDRLLWSHGHRPVAISQYATGLAASRGDLPAAPWRRLLRRHFTRVEELVHGF